MLGGLGGVPGCGPGEGVTVLAGSGSERGIQGVKQCTVMLFNNICLKISS